MLDKDMCQPGLHAGSRDHARHRIGDVLQATPGSGKRENGLMCHGRMLLSMYVATLLHTRIMD
jgi:hypothetical protein